MTSDSDSKQEPVPQDHIEDTTEAVSARKSVGVVEARGVTRVIVRWLVNQYYPNIEFRGRDRITQTGPVLICANHANSLVDPVVLGLTARRPVRFMAKAPLFENPVIGPPMKALGMIPAFRGSDDAKEVKRNLESLDVGAHVLCDGSAMGIFPEGKSTDVQHVEMIRSGAARMALQALKEGAEGLQILCVGLTYEKKEQFRSSVLVQVADPIDVQSILDEHDGNERRARRAVTEAIESRLKGVVVHLEKPEWEPVLNDLETLAQSPMEQTRQLIPPLHRRKRIADAINHFAATQPDRVDEVRAKIEAYRQNVSDAGLSIHSPILRYRGWRVATETLWRVFLLLFLLPPALIGTLHHLAPFVLVRGIAGRMDQQGRKTISTNRLLVGVPVYLLWYLLVGWWMFDYYSNWFAAGWLAAAPTCGVIALNYWRKAKETVELLWHELVAWRRKAYLEQLRRQEDDLSHDLSAMASDYAVYSPIEHEPKTSMLQRDWPRIASRLTVVAAAMAGIWVGKYLLFDRPLRGNGLDLQNTPVEVVEGFLEADEQTLVRVIDGMDELETASIVIDREFANGDRNFTQQQDNDDVRELLRRYIAYREALLRIIWRYQRYAEVEDDALRTRAFLIDLTAASTLYQASLKFVGQFEKSPKAIAKLNEAEPEWGIPANFYNTVRRNLASPGNIRAFELAQQYYRLDAVKELFEQHDLRDRAPYDKFHSSILRAEDTILKQSGTVVERVTEVAIADAADLLYDVQYRSQSEISTWIGDFKIRDPHRGESLISKSELEQLAEVLEPGDVILERRNWYLSNAFLPGYWPHGAVYVGTTDELKARELDQDPRVRQHWEQFAHADSDGHEHVIIEAVSEGVIFSSLEHSIGGADSVAVLRPQVSEETKSKAISRAFGVVGRPYDFEFDFESTDTLVCTEVVYHAYGRNSGELQFPVQKIMGRQTMPAINLVKKFNEEYGTDNVQFEFIAFIDGDEAMGSATFLTDVDAFRETVDRPASSFLQASDPFSLRSIGPLGWVLLACTLAAAVCLVIPRVRRNLRVPSFE